jgi:hypothetical protein
MVKWYIQYTGIVNGILIYYNAIMNIVNIVNPTIWVNFITAEPCPPEPWESWFRYRGIVPKWPQDSS